MVRIVLALLLVITLLLPAGCSQTPAPAGNTPGTHEATGAATVAPAQLLQLVAGSPEEYIGREVTVEGVLEAEGQVLDMRFYLRGAGGERLEVSSWAPLEVVQPPDSGSAPPTMTSYVGKHLRLTGIVAKGGDGTILQVSKFEELS